MDGDGDDAGRGAADEWAPGARVLEDFEVERALGRGGMGAVYLLRSRSTGRAFAVKRALLREPSARRALLGELQTWIDLPEHPHLLPCRFFRTVGDEVALFTDYVDGGSLADAVADGRVAALDAILDAAIQLAWGLHAAHGAGVVHQDVKPANALLARADGSLRVADFGLARARAAAAPAAPTVPYRRRAPSDISPDSSELAEPSPNSPPTPSRPLLASSVTRAGMTAAYCSPEQAAGRPLTHRTDVYSWAVSVLELFTGEVSWLDGQAAPLVLERLLKRGPRPGRPAVPPAVADVLRRALARDPAARPATLALAADALIAAYGAACGRPYPRAAPPADPAAAARRFVPIGRAGATGARWRPGVLWVATALELAGRDAAEADALAAQHRAETAASPRAQLVADLSGYAAAAAVLTELLASGRVSVVPALTQFYLELGSVHTTAGDLPGALAAYDQALAVLDALPARPEVACAAVMNSKAATLRAARRADEAAALLEQTVALLEPHLATALGGERLRAMVAFQHGVAAQNLAIARFELGRPREAAAAAARAVAVLEPLLARLDAAAAAQDDGDDDAAARGASPEMAARALAAAFEVAGVAARALGDPQGALAAFARTLALRERVVAAGGADLTEAVAAALRNQAMAHYDLGDAAAAAALHARAVAILDELVAQHARTDLEEDLAGALGSLAYARAGAGERAAAFALFDRAIALYGRLVEAEGRDDLANELARVQLNCAVVRAEAGEHAAARALYDRVIATRERLVAAGQLGVRRELALAYTNQGNTLGDLGEHAAALALLDRAVALRTTLVHAEGHDELRGELALAHLNRAEARRASGDTAGAVADLARGAALLEPPPPGMLPRAVTRRRAEALSACGALRLERREDPAAAALEELDQALALYDALARGTEDERVARDDERSLEALVLMFNHAGALLQAGRGAEAVAVYDRVIAHAAARCAARADAPDAAHALHVLAVARGNQAMTLTALGVGGAAVAEHFEQARAAYARAVARGGPALAAAVRGEIAQLLRHRAWHRVAAGDAEGGLAALADAAALRLLDAGDAEGAELLPPGEGPTVAEQREVAVFCSAVARVLGQRADTARVRRAAELGIALWSRVIAAGPPDGGADFEGDLAGLRVMRAVALFNQGEPAAARREARAALETLAREAPRTGRPELAQMLAWAQSVFGPLLDPPASA